MTVATVDSEGLSKNFSTITYGHTLHAATNVQSWCTTNVVNHIMCCSDDSLWFSSNPPTATDLIYCIRQRRFFYPHLGSGVLTLDPVSWPLTVNGAGSGFIRWLQGRTKAEIPSRPSRQLPCGPRNSGGAKDPGSPCGVCGSLPNCKFVL